MASAARQPISGLSFSRHLAIDVDLQFSTIGTGAAANGICMAENRRTTTGWPMLAGAAPAAAAAWLLEANHHPAVGVVRVVAFAVLPGLLVDWHHPARSESSRSGATTGHLTSALASHWS
jgi:hypothetical protein